MTPFPETTTGNTDGIDWRIHSFLDAPINPDDRLDSVFPKNIHSKSKLYERFGKKELEDFKVVETYVTEHGKTQHKVIALDQDNGIYAIQERSGTNGESFEKKAWGGTRLCRLGEVENDKYLTYLKNLSKKLN